MLKREARTVVGGLSKPGKMPGFGISIPPEYCHVGAKLREIQNTVCFDCYACKGMYRFPVVIAAMQRRYKLLTRVLAAGPGSEVWREYVRAFQTLLRTEQYFRVHDAGDLQGQTHLLLWFEIARACPDCMFWIPTKELGIIRRAELPWEFDRLGHAPRFTIPKNMVIRYSAPMLDTVTEKWYPNSATFRNPKDAPQDSFVCPAPLQENACGDCRACWDSTVQTIIYPKH